MNESRMNIFFFFLQLLYGFVAISIQLRIMLQAAQIKICSFLQLFASTAIFSVLESTKESQAESALPIKKDKSDGTSVG